MTISLTMTTKLIELLNTDNNPLLSTIRDYHKKATEIKNTNSTDDRDCVFGISKSILIKIAKKEVKLTTDLTSSVLQETINGLINLANQSNLTQLAEQARTEASLEINVKLTKLKNLIVNLEAALKPKSTSAIASSSMTLANNSKPVIPLVTKENQNNPLNGDTRSVISHKSQMSHLTSISNVSHFTHVQKNVQNLANQRNATTTIEQQLQNTLSIDRFNLLKECKQVLSDAKNLSSAASIQNEVKQLITALLSPGAFNKAALDFTSLSTSMGPAYYAKIRSLINKVNDSLNLDNKENVPLQTWAEQLTKIKLDTANASKMSM